MLQYPRLIIFIISYLLISEQRLNWVKFEDSSLAEVESEDLICYQKVTML